MPRFLAPLLVLTMLACPLAAWAQQPAAQENPALQAAQNVQDPKSQVEKQIDDARSNLQRLADLIERAKDDDNRLAQLKVDADAAVKQSGAIASGAAPRLDEIKARLTELGDPPGDGAPPEADVVKQERDRLIAERGQLNALTGTAEDLSAQATDLSNGITATRRVLFSNALLRYTDINGDMIMEAMTAITQERQALGRTIGSWITFAWNFKRVQLLTALFFSLCAALVLHAGTRRIFAPVIHREGAFEDPGYITRLSVAFWLTMIPTVAMVVFSLTSFFLLRNLNVLRPDIAPLIAVSLAVCTAMVFVHQLARAVFAPDQNTWRLVRVSDRGARLLVFSIVAMALVNSLDYVAGVISEVLGSPVVVTVVKSLIASVIIGLIFIAMSFIKPIVPKGEKLNGKGRPWPRAVKALLIGTGASLIVISLSGYVGLARFAATQIVMTGAVLVTMYIGFLTGKAIAKQNALADTIVGRYLERRYRLEQVGLDQAGLALGLSIYALVVLFFIPLIFLQWGFKIADIRAWAFQVFTEIKIGSITISIVGIIAGIILFIIGYVVTRWLQKWLDGNVMARSRVDPGVRNSVKTGVGYLGVGIAGLMGISATGLNLSNLALIAGGLSLGVGFGLQNIVSNFVSGLILLVERPFKVGDWVVTGTTEGFVRRISVRATEIETFQRQTIMVPNSLFINASVGNWTHRNKLGRSDISVTVGYDSTPRKVMDALLEIAATHQLVLKNPEPQAVFTAFGETTMTFELRIYLADIVNGNGVRNDLRLAIYERFRQEGLGAPFTKVELEPEVVPPGPESDAIALNPEARPEPPATVPVAEPVVTVGVPPRSDAGEAERPAAAAAQSSGSQRKLRRVSIEPGVSEER